VLANIFGLTFPRHLRVIVCDCTSVAVELKSLSRHLKTHSGFQGTKKQREEIQQCLIDLDFPSILDILLPNPSSPPCTFLKPARVGLKCACGAVFGSRSSLNRHITSTTNSLNLDQHSVLKQVLVQQLGTNKNNTVFFEVTPRSSSGAAERTDNLPSDEEMESGGEQEEAAYVGLSDEARAILEANRFKTIEGGQTLTREQSFAAPWMSGTDLMKALRYFGPSPSSASVKKAYGMKRGVLDWDGEKKLRSWGWNKRAEETAKASGAALDDSDIDDEEDELPVVEAVVFEPPKDASLDNPLDKIILVCGTY
jgi:hypothetical protein